MVSCICTSWLLYCMWVVRAHPFQVQQEAVVQTTVADLLCSLRRSADNPGDTAIVVGKYAASVEVQRSMQDRRDDCFYGLTHAVYSCTPAVHHVDIYSTEDQK